MLLQDEYQFAPMLILKIHLHYLAHISLHDIMEHLDSNRLTLVKQYRLIFVTANNVCSILTIA